MKNFCNVLQRHFVEEFKEVENCQFLDGKPKSLTYDY